MSKKWSTQSYVYFFQGSSRGPLYFQLTRQKNNQIYKITIWVSWTLDKCLLSHFPVEYLDSVLVIYQDLLAGKSPNTVIVPTSTSIEQLPSVASEENDRDEQQQQDGVEPATLSQRIEALCDRFKCR